MMPVPLKYFGLALTLALVTDLAVGQHYHFSNGWKSGRKRSGGVSNLCEMRPELINYINTLVSEELNRIKTNCFLNTEDKDSDVDFSEGAFSRLQNGLKLSADRKWKK